MKNTDKNNFNATIGNTVLCDGFLIPMTDFVNNVGNMENYPSHEKALSWIYSYATFLKQPLKLEMFVPCGDNGDILGEPKNHTLLQVKIQTSTLKNGSQKQKFTIKPKKKFYLKGLNYMRIMNA